MEKNQKIQFELETAAKAQYQLLPRDLPEVSGVDVGWQFIPSVYVAGDMFNFFQVDEEHVSFYILDVMGHGISAALRAVTVNHILKPSSLPCSQIKGKEETLNQILYSPAKTLQMLNDRFTDKNKFVSFFTSVYGVINTKNLTLRYARAGHNPPILISANKEVLELKQGGPAIGFAKKLTYHEYEMKLTEGDKLLLYTDGIVEAKSIDNQVFTKQDLSI